MPEKESVLVQHMAEAGFIVPTNVRPSEHFSYPFDRTVNDLSFSRYGKFTEITVRSYSLDKNADVE